jgi:apolipoprotein N-acyltransferase
MRVPLRSQLTPADRAGDWPQLVIIVLTVMALGWALIRRNRSAKN